MQRGYSSHWPASKSPYFVKLGGQKIACDVHAYVRYVRHREPTWAERAAAAPAVVDSDKNPIVKRPRFAETPVMAGGGNAPAVPGAAEAVPPTPIPEGPPSDDGVDETAPDGEGKGFPHPRLRPSR